MRVAVRRYGSHSLEAPARCEHDFVVKRQFSVHFEAYTPKALESSTRQIQRCSRPYSHRTSVPFNSQVDTHTVLFQSLQYAFA
jgi:hypothetical protein